MAADETRYSRQTRFRGLGEEGQAGLQRGTVCVVGMGALGSASAPLLVRAGVGRVRLIDRDIVDLSNLHRQLLYNEDDARRGLPKAVAARQHLQAANSSVGIEAEVADLTPGNVDRLLAGAQVVVDGTDNFETRYLLNEWSVREGVPWIYGAAVGAYGLMFPVLPGQGACLQCVFESPPDPATSPTCETAGVVAPITALIGSLQAAEAMKILAGALDQVSRVLTAVDVWDGRIQQVAVQARAEGACPVCQGRRFPHLERRAGSSTLSLCGRNAVQVRPRSDRGVDLDVLARRLEALGEVTRNDYLIRVHVDGLELTVFTDGRSLVRGTEDEAAARTLVSRYVGA